MSSRGALNLPVPVRVLASTRGEPRKVDGSTIELVRESWLVEDRWWTGRPLRRRYWELVGALGQNMVVFHDLGTNVSSGDSHGGGERGGWFSQQA